MKAAAIILAVVLMAAPARSESGIASVYSDTRTASGERFDSSAMTCAHRSAAFGTMLTITHRVTGRSVRCRVNDRGPFIRGRIVDLSRAVARALGLGYGLAPVSVGR